MKLSSMLAIKKIIVAVLSTIHCGLVCAEELRISVKISPAGLFTLVAPYSGTVELVRSAETIAVPLPDEWPVGILSRGSALEPDRAKYLARASKIALAEITPLPQHDLNNSISARLDAFHKEFARYGLKRTIGNTPPWLRSQSSLNQRRLMEAFFADYMSSEIYIEWLDRPSDSMKALASLRATGVFPKEVTIISEKVIRNRKIKLSQTDKNVAIVKILKWIARNDLANNHLVRRDPYTNESFEPNNTDLISPDGKIRIVVGRGAGQSSQPLGAVPALDDLRRYWLTVVEQDIFDENDVFFLNQLLFSRKIDISEANRLTMARTIIDEASKAQPLIAKGYALGTLIYFASIGNVTPDLNTNVAALKKHADQSFSYIKFSDQELIDSAHGLTLAVRPTFTPRPDVPFPPPLPAYDSIARIGNELRPTQHYEGSVLDVSERDGLIKLQEDKRWFHYNLTLWTVEVPLGGGVDNSTFADIANFNAVRSPKHRYSDLEQIFDVEIAAALALSPTFFSVSRMISFDSIASALREFDFRKVDTGRNISSIAERIRVQMRGLDELIAQKNKDEQGGYFFPPYPSLVVNSRVKIGDKVEPGTPIAVVRPLHQYRADISIPIARLPQSLAVGSTLKLRLSCNGNMPLPGSVAKSHAGLPKLKVIFDRALASSDLNVEIVSLEPVEVANETLYHASGYLTTPAEFLLGEIKENDIKDLGTLAALVISGTKRAVKLKPPLGMLPGYSACTVDL